MLHMERSWALFTPPEVCNRLCRYKLM